MKFLIYFGKQKDKRNDCSFARFLLIKTLPITVLCFCVFAFSTAAFAQTKKTKAKIPVKKAVSVKSLVAVNLPKVTQIDGDALQKLLKPNGKPLLINFWATWCEPCREEFPDLVKINADYKDKIDVIAISLDELSEINNDVPKFLAQMKAEMPAYLLKTPNEEAVIAAVSKDWRGGLPFSILINAAGEAIYMKEGKFKADFLRGEIDKSLLPTPK